MPARSPWLLLAFFGAVWLYPVAYQGLRHRPAPGIPPLLQQTTNVSCLFLRSSYYTPVQYIQVLGPGATDWTTEDDRDYLRMSPFGFRNRFDELLRKQLANPRALQELAAYVRVRHARRTGNSLVGVRFVTGIVVNEPSPPGRFCKPPIEEIPHVRREVWFTQIYAPVPPEILRRRG